MSILNGKGMWIWKIPSCEGGNPAAIARVASAAGFSHVMIKIANDTRPYNVDSEGHDLVMPVVDALRAKGIGVWGWHYVYGYDPAGEAAIAISQTKKFGMDGYIIDAEAEYKLAGREAVARSFMTALRKGLPSRPVALSSYRWPSYHPTFPFEAFLEKCDLNMPQVYWMLAHDPAADLKKSVSEFKALTPSRPVIPTGPAFYESSWAPSANETITFMNTARSLGLTAANFFSWDESRTKLPAVWNAIANYDWPIDGPIETDLADQIFAALNAGEYDPFLEIYAPNAVLVTSEQTLQSNTDIRVFWGRILTNKLNDGIFTIKTKEVSGNTIHYTWSCTSYRGKVKDGQDTLGIKNNKVIYHYSHFNIVA
jgi:hypothetical protein